MKVLFVSDEFYITHESYNWSGYANRPIVEQMPCETVICCSTEEVRKHAPTADVVLLESLRAVAFRDELLFLNDMPLLTGAFYCDVWRGPYWLDHKLRTDVHISIYKDAAHKSRVEFRDPSIFFWAPPRVHLFNCDVPRDIDIVYWGATAREYPFRRFIYFTLINLIVGGPRHSGHQVTKPNPFLTLAKVELRGQQYTWGHLANKRLSPRYHGPELAELLCRCKLCPTGPPIMKNSSAAVARYIENAAHGVISVTSDIDDKEELGFKHKENIWFTDAEHFISDMTYLLENDDLVERMSVNARELVCARHTVDVRSQELYAFLCEKTGKT